MGLFKKKERIVITDLKCPSEGCNFVCTDKISLKRHIEWKHPELPGKDAKIAKKAN